MTRFNKLAMTIALGVIAIIGSVTMAPSAAFAGSGVGTDGTGITVTTVACPSMQNPKTGTAHARIRDCKVEYINDSIDASNSVYVTFQLLDAATDGHCATAKVGGPGFSTTTFTECDGVWTTETWSRNDPPGFTGVITISLGYGVGTPTTWTAS